MNIKQLNVQAAIPLTVAGLLAITAPSAEAVTFSSGDILSGNATFQLIGDSATSLNFDFLNQFGEMGSDGTFGVNNNSTGGFAAYINGGATTDAAYQIKDTDFGAVTSITNFLSYDDGPGGLDSWSMDWKNISILADASGPGGFRVISLIGDAIFRGSNTVPGSGGFASFGRVSSTVVLDQGNSASLTYTVAVPEPFTILGTVAAIGFGGLFQRERSKRQQKATAEA